MKNKHLLVPMTVRVSINAAASLSDLDFIYHLLNLKKLSIRESAYITKDLLDYLENNNITTNLTEQDIINSETTDEIIESIITPNMSENKKIQAVCSYVIDQIDYDIDALNESNYAPLTSALETGLGVCSSYAYLTTVLFNKAGIECYNVTNDKHEWNIIKLNDGYRYVDNYSIDNSAIDRFLLERLNFSSFYMVSPNRLFLSPMSKATDEQTVIPASFMKAKDE